MNEIHRHTSLRVSSGGKPSAVKNIVAPFTDSSLYSLNKKYDEIW